MSACMHACMQIALAPPPGFACRCDFHVIWGCSAAIVACEDPGSPACKRPDVSIATCELGGGDCSGY